MSCPEYRPDHNGECLNCDEPLDGHASWLLAQLDAARAEIARLQTENQRLQAQWDELVRNGVVIIEEPDYGAGLHEERRQRAAKAEEKEAAMNAFIRTDLQNFLDELNRQPAIDLVIDGQPIRSLLQAAIAALDQQEQTITDLRAELDVS